MRFLLHDILLPEEKAACCLTLNYKRSFLVAAIEAEYCLWDTVDERCAPNEVIVFTMATFGRMKSGGKCTLRDRGSLGNLAKGRVVHNALSLSTLGQGRP